MPARKNRPNKYGIRVLTRQEQLYLRYWFRDTRNHLWISSINDTVHSGEGFDTGAGHVVRGLVSKQILKREEVRGEPDWIPEARIQYSLTPAGYDALGWGRR